MLFEKKAAFDWMIVALGNPGLQYEKTRHNAGFMTADKIASEYGVNLGKQKMDAVYGDFMLNSNRVLLVKPQTYMNNSGTAVNELTRFYKIPSDRIIVIFDDISLDVGKIRIRRKGSHGGHNGIKDIIELLGTDEIMRIKIGVGERPHPDYDLKDWVLGKIPKEQQKDFDSALETASLAIKEIITRGIDSAMNKYNS